MRRFYSILTLILLFALFNCTPDQMVVETGVPQLQEVEMLDIENSRGIPPKNLPDYDEGTTFPETKEAAFLSVAKGAFITFGPMLEAAIRNPEVLAHFPGDFELKEYEEDYRYRVFGEVIIVDLPIIEHCLYYGIINKLKIYYDFYLYMKTNRHFSGHVIANAFVNVEAKPAGNVKHASLTGHEKEKVYADLLLTGPWGYLKRLKVSYAVNLGYCMNLVISGPNGGKLVTRLKMIEEGKVLIETTQDIYDFLESINPLLFIEVYDNDDNLVEIFNYTKYDLIQYLSTYIDIPLP